MPNASHSVSVLPPAQQVRIELADRSYDILIGSALLGRDDRLMIIRKGEADVAYHRCPPAPWQR